MSDKEDRKHKATGQRRQQARDKGQVARSREVPYAVTFLFAVLYLGYEGHSILDRLQEPFRVFWGRGISDPITSANVLELFTKAGWLMIAIAGPLLGLILVTSVSLVAAQGGVAINGEKLIPKFNKLNPASNAKKILSKSSLVQLAKSVAVVAILSYVAWAALRDNVDQISLLPSMELVSILSVWGELVYSICIKIAVILAVISRRGLPLSTPPARRESEDDLPGGQGRAQGHGRESGHQEPDPKTPV